MFPSAIFVLWWVGLIVTLLVFVPLAVYLLHNTWRAARSIEVYARESLVAAGGIAGNTKNISALDATIAIAVEILGTAGAVEKKLETVASVLAGRAR